MTITSTKALIRSRHLGGGFDSSGNPKQGKVMVVGRMIGTYADGGVAISAQDLGLTAIDYVDFRVTTPAVDADGSHFAHMTASTFFVVSEAMAEIGNSTAFVVEFCAHGDSADDVELT